MDKQEFLQANSPPLCHALQAFAKDHHLPYFTLSTKALEAFRAPCSYPVSAEDYQEYFEQGMGQESAPVYAMVYAWDFLSEQNGSMDPTRFILTDADRAIEWMEAGDWQNYPKSDGFDEEHAFFWVAREQVRSSDYAEDFLQDGVLDTKELAEALQKGILPQEFEEALLPPDAQPETFGVESKVARTIREFRQQAEQEGFSVKESNLMLLSALDSLNPSRSHAAVK